jgi:tetratricopeptide (TPR) repeat protein
MKRQKTSRAAGVAKSDAERRARSMTTAKGGATGREPQASWIDRHFTQLLIGLCLVGLIIRCIILAGYCGTPLALQPVNDARVYWEWAGDIAAGKVVLDHPFFSAPLYPYLLGGIRWLGAQTTLVYVLQMLGDLAAVVLLASVCRGRFGAGVALLAAGLYLALLEPASAMLRILASSLHLMLVVLVWAALVRVQNRQSWQRLLAVGAALGLLAVAYAPAVLLLPAVAVWLFAICGSRRAPADGVPEESKGCPGAAKAGLATSDAAHTGLMLRVGKALLPAVVAAAIIAPATIHNWYASGGGFFPVQAGGGITLLQGNYANSTGLYTPIPGVSAARELMHDDTQTVYREATGREPHWADVDCYFRDQALHLWRSQPAKLVELAARKLYLFISSRHYADIYPPTDEMAQGVNTRLRLTPLPLPWLTGPALVGLVLMLRRPRAYAPEWMLLALPLLVVVTFFYSPRYRVPAIPIVVIAAAWAFVYALRRRARWPVLGTVVLGLGLGILLEPVNKHFNVDRPSRTATLYNLAYALRLEHRLDEAIDALRKGLEISPQDGPERVMLAEALAEAGRHEEAVVEFRRALSANSAAGELAIKLARSLLALERLADADQVLTAAVEREPHNVMLLAMLASTKYRAGQSGAACAYYDKALYLASNEVPLLIEYGNVLISLGRWDEAHTQFEHALYVEPDNFLANYRMAVIAGHAGRYEEARQRFERVASIQPNNHEIVYDMGYLEMIQGHREEAIRLLRKALELNPNYEPAKDRLRELGQG